MHDVADAVDKFDKNPDVGCMVITGSERAFAGKSLHLRPHARGAFASSPSLPAPPRPVTLSWR